MAIKKGKIICQFTGKFWLNEQDSYEPTGIRYCLCPHGRKSHDFAYLLKTVFGCQKLGFDGKAWNDHKPVKLKIIISRED